MNKIAILLVAVLFFALSSGIGTASEIFVGTGESIQAALNNVASGDVVIVKPGNYTENIRVTTPNLVIRSESGNPKDTVINARGGANLFSITANNVTISGFRIESAEAGIYLSRCSGCTVANNEFLHNRLGVHLNSANNNRISQNKINSNEKHGIQLVNSEGNQLLNNIINSNERGINSLTSNKSTISGNDVSYNTEFGMWVSQSHDNKITGNTVNESSRGIHQNSSSRNTISGNIIAFNNVSGLFECPGCHNNRIFNNYFNNIYNANIKTRDTTWNTTKTVGTNIVGGPYLGGNFWANPEGTGFSQTAQDTDKDGIADTGYNTSNISDFLPLVSGSGQEIVPPAANFNANVMNGTAPLSVQFRDSSQNAISWNWDFDTDGNLDSQIPNPVYVYRTPGNYTVTLTVSNGNSISVKTARVIVEAESSEANLLPVPEFKNNLIGDSSDLSVQFTDTSQNTGWRTWYFGDGIIDNPFIPENGKIIQKLPLSFIVVTIDRSNATIIHGITPHTI
jgi:parallel beta-helix repeat protein